MGNGHSRLGESMHRPKSNQEFFLLATEQGVHLHITATILIEHAVDPELWTRTTKAVLERHDAFSIGYRKVDGEFCANVQTEVSVDIEFVSLAENEVEVDIRRLAARDNARPFDLAKPPLARFTVAAVPPGTTAIIATFHHAAVDGWSVHLLLQQLIHEYGAARSGVFQKGRSSRTTYWDELLREEAELNTIAVSERLAWWGSQLNDLPWVANAGGERRLNWVGRFLDVGVGRREEMRNRVLAAYATALGELGFLNPDVINLSFSHRGLKERSAVGLFSDVLPVPLCSLRDETFEVRCDRVRQAILGAEQNVLPSLFLLKRLRPKLFKQQGVFGLCVWPARHQFNPRPRFTFAASMFGMNVTWRPDLGAFPNWAGADTELILDQLPNGWQLGLAFNASEIALEAASELVERIALIASA